MAFLYTIINKDAFIANVIFLTRIGLDMYVVGTHRNGIMIATVCLAVQFTGV